MKTKIIVMTAFSTLSCLAQATENASSLTDQILDNALFSDAKLDLSLRNYWKYLKEDAANPKEVHAAWGQGVVLDYKSGYWADLVGFDASYYGAIKLGASDYFDTRGILFNEGSGFDKNNAKGFNKIGQRYVKFKLDLDPVKLNVQGGWQALRNYGVITTSYRLSPNTYLGWSGSANIDAFTLRTAYITSVIDRASPEKKPLQTRDGQQVGHITTTDLLYKSKLLSTQYAYGESQDYLRRHLLISNLKPIEKLDIGTQIYYTKALDSYTAMTANRRDFDDTASHFAFDSKWQEDNWSAKVGVGYTRAEKQNAVGFYPRHLNKYTRGTFTSMASTGEDYLRDGETVFSFINDYKVTPDFTVGLTGNYAQFHYQNNTVKTGEINLFGRWVPSESRLKNLTVFAMVGPGWSYKNKNKTPILTDGEYRHARSLGAEVIIDYKVNIF